MRTIKFRGKDIESGQWAIGDLHTLCDKPHIHTEHTSFPFAGKRSFVNPDTIGQFTGLHDKNGKEIYEGDILTDSWVDFSRKPAYLTVVIFKDGAFGFDLHYDGFTPMQHLMSDNMKFEVIGNIFDNPELLK